MKKSGVHILALSAFSVMSGSAFGAGFAVSEQSVSALGTGFAGAGALSEDASNQFFNPATLGGLDEAQVSGAFHYLMIDTEFEDDNAATTGDFEDVEEPVGSGFFAMPFRDDMTFGVSVTAPYGTLLEYEPLWGGVVTPVGFSTGELYAQKSDLMTINVNPAVAWEMNEFITIGAGVSWQRLEADLENAATRLEGDDDGYGWNIGAVMRFGDEHRLGLSWRSKVDYDVEGDITFKEGGLIAQGVPPATAAALAGTYSAQTDVTLPAMASASFVGHVNDLTDILLGVTWTEWSELQSFAVTHSGPTGLPDPLVEELEWNNSVRSSIGIRHKLSEDLIVRAGYAHETSTQEDDEERSALVPDADRDWITIGARMFPREDLSVDLGYAHVMVDDAGINRSDRGPLVGEYELSANIVGAQVNWKF